MILHGEDQDANARSVFTMRRLSSALVVAAAALACAACGSGNSSSAQGGGGENLGGDDTSWVAPTPSSSSASPSEPELKVGQAVSYTSTDGAQLQITLTAAPTFKKASKEDVKITHEDSDMTRIGRFPLTIKNVGSKPFEGTTFGGSFVSSQGQQYDFSGVQCDKDDLSFDTLAPGRFVKGDACYFVPADAGHLEFADPDATTTPFYIDVPAG